jgi:hypothetical protein
VENKKIAISFASQDLTIAEKVIIGLCENGHSIVVTNEKLSTKIFEEYKDQIWLINHSQDDGKEVWDDVQYCIVILSNSYAFQQWNKTYKNRILDISIKRNKIILPFRIDNLSFLVDVTFQFEIIPIDSAQTIIDVFLKINKDAYSLNYTGIGSLLKSYYGKFEITKIDELLGVNEIGYKFYSVSDPTQNGKIHAYYLYLPLEINYRKTFQHLNSTNYRFGATIRSGGVTILTTKNPDRKAYSQIKEYIQKTFSANNLFFVDEFIHLHCFPKEFRDSRLYRSDESFIDPLLKIANNGPKRATEYFKEWAGINDSDGQTFPFISPILIITGDGGIGKTTLARKCADIWESEKLLSKVIYIDSGSIIDYYGNENVEQEVDVYTLYKNAYRNQDDSLLSRDLFATSFDNGNLLIVIDGFDEIISTLGINFDIGKFIQSIFFDLPKVKLGKVLIASRNYLLLSESIEENYFINKAEILPFDLALATKYFNYQLRDSPSLVSKAIAVLKNFYKDNTDKYIPFVLDIVSYIVTQEHGNVIDSELETEILSPNDNDDYIIAKICGREYDKNGKLKVDEQITVFQILAVKYNSSVSKEEIKDILYESLQIIFDDDFIDKFTLHPLLRKDVEKYAFKYDFLGNYFKSLYLYRAVKNYSSVDAIEIDLLATSIKFNSYFIVSISKRFLPDGNDYKLIIDEKIKNVKKCKNIDNTKLRKAISGLFSIALSVNSLSSGGYETEKNTDLLKFFFEVSSLKNRIKEAYLLDFIGSDRDILFDFSGLTIEDSMIAGYANFWECKFDESTIFDNCILVRLLKKETYNTSAKGKNFNTNCTIDESVKKALDERDHSHKLKAKHVTDDLKTFFRFFYEGGSLKNFRTEDAIIARKSCKYLQTNEVLKSLIKKGILKKYEVKANLGKDAHKVKYCFAEEYSKDIDNFCTQGTFSKKIYEIINLFIKIEDQEVAEKAIPVEFSTKEKQQYLAGSIESARNKAKEVLAILKAQNVETKEYTFINLGGGDASEIIYELNNSSSSHGVLLELDNDQIEKASLNIKQHLSHGKQIQVFRGDINDPKDIDTIKRKLTEKRVKGIIITIHAVLHELSQRSNYPFIPSVFFTRLFNLHDHIILIIREPGKAIGNSWDNTKGIFIQVKELNDLFKLHTASELLRNQYFRGSKIEIFENQNRIYFDNKDLAIEALFILFYWEDREYELQEQKTSFEFISVYKILRNTQWKIIDHKSFSSISFKAKLQSLGVNFFDEDLTLLPEPSCFHYIIAQT